TPTISLSAAPEFRQTVPLFPGSYQVRFSDPVPANPLEEMSGTLHWLEPVRLRKEQLAELKVTIPAIPKEAISHVRLKKAGPMAPFTSLTMEPVSGTDRSGVMTSRWDYFSVEQLWPDEVKVNLLPGSYRMILSAPAGPGYSSLKYEVPEPATLGSGTVEVPIQRPTFHTLKAGLTDRKGTPLRGTPLLLYGSGQTTVVLDSGPGNIEVRIPEGRYTVRALIFDDKGSREVTLERNLDLSKDQERAWKAPTTAIDFGFPQPAPSGSPTGSATILP
ncbi:MAG: hypothetical protein KY468_11025, partial [Armatimonadetes bacterium]|nr:hypothetical protein [Armatimonadota bacterium]